MTAVLGCHIRTGSEWSIRTFRWCVQAEHPCLLGCFDQFLSLASRKRVVVFLDYDGTLTPIVSNPDLAVMSEAMRGTVKRVAQTFPTAIITGRGRRKVEDFVQLDELFYAGSHGLDIKGPVVSCLLATLVLSILAWRATALHFSQLYKTLPCHRSILLLPNCDSSLQALVIMVHNCLRRIREAQVLLLTPVCVSRLKR